MCLPRADAYTGPVGARTYSRDSWANLELATPSPVYARPMYSLGLDAPESDEHLRRTLALIDHLEEPQTHSWISASPSASSEIARLNKAVPDGPVSLEGTLRSATMSALESAAQIRFSIQCRHYTLTSLRAMMRTILMGAGRLGFVALPDAIEVREANAATLVRQEARSFKHALKDVNGITNVLGLKWEPDKVDEFEQQIAGVNTDGLRGDRAMIREAAGLMGAQAATADPTIGQAALRDHLTWVWHTSSGSAHGFDWQSRASGDFVTDIGAVASAFHSSFDATRRMWQ